MPKIDFDLLAEYLKTRMETGRYSLRRASSEIGCSPTTLGRILKGSKNQITPDTVNLHRTVEWLGYSLSEFEGGSRPNSTTLETVEVHLRALEGVSEPTAAAMVAAVRALYEFEQQKPDSQSS